MEGEGGIPWRKREGEQTWVVVWDAILFSVSPSARLSITIVLHRAGIHFNEFAFQPSRVPLHFHLNFFFIVRSRPRSFDNFYLIAR